jgi:hypothetical protein
MNFTNYEKWLKTQLIHNLLNNSVLVVDNASYHNVRVAEDKEATSATLKKEMIEWLRKNIHFEGHMTKSELYEIIKRHKTKEPSYRVDRLLSDHGHTLLRLPPYHPELNAIEKIWALVKNWVAANNVSFKLDDVEQLPRTRFDSVTSAEWSRICNHVQRIEKEYIEREHLMDQTMKMMFQVNTGDSDFSDSEDSEASDFESDDTDSG